MPIARLSSLLVALLVAIPARSGLDEQAVNFELSARARKLLERQACLEPFNVKAADITGWRNPDDRKEPLHAQVTCADHVIGPAYSAHYSRHCSRTWAGWSCEEPLLWVETKFLDRGPLKITFPGFELEGALGALKCLERGLTEPGTFEMLELNRKFLPLELRAETSGEFSGSAEALLEGPHQCARLRLPADCDEAGDVQLIGYEACLQE